LRANTTKQKLKAGQTVFGCFIRYPDPSLVELLGYASWDFLVLDGEHGTLEPRDCENMVRSAELRDLTPIVRVPANLPPVILRLMDTGAQGLHVPNVNTADQAEAVVRAVKYQPRGMRGLAGVRAADYAQAASFNEYVERANHESLVVVHVESTEAIEHLPGIVATRDIDVVFIGPTDLSHSLGVPGQLQHPALQAAMQRIVDIVNPSPAALGIMVGNAAGAREWQARGARYITVGLEAVLMPAIRDYLAAVRGE
jgi:4-hydroxy-2-oxoheptanedioate aldolase